MLPPEVDEQALDPAVSAIVCVADNAPTTLIDIACTGLGAAEPYGVLVGGGVASGGGVTIGMNGTAVGRPGRVPEDGAGAGNVQGR